MQILALNLLHFSYLDETSKDDTQKNRDWLSS